jgi:hypothetical protein
VAGAGGGLAGVEGDVEEHQDTDIACVVRAGQKTDRAALADRGTTQQSEHCFFCFLCVQARRGLVQHLTAESSSSGKAAACLAISWRSGIAQAGPRLLLLLGRRTTAILIKEVA